MLVELKDKERFQVSRVIEMKEGRNLAKVIYSCDVWHCDDEDRSSDTN